MMKISNLIRKGLCVAAAAALIFSLAACGGNSTMGNGSASADEHAAASAGSKALATDKLKSEKNISSSLTYTDTLPLKYAKCFSIFNYDGGYSLINIADGTRYLTVPEGKTAPDDLADDITVLRQPVQNIYMAGSACMDMFVKMNALDSVSLSGIQADQWYIPEARAAMKSGSITYAGKYNTPDYELILSRKCGLAVENTMILHNPEVREQIMKTGIPVIIDHSSYESHPLGRTEWVKVYGTITGHSEEAESAFEQQAGNYEQAASGKSSGKKAAYFSITSNGAVNVRKSTDYIPAMIKAAGGTYVPATKGDGKLTSTSRMQMEEFCASVRDANVLIYNSTIEGQIKSVNELLEKAPALKNCRAVKNGNVWCTEQNVYQDSMEAGTITSELRKIFTGSDSGLDYFFKLK